MPMAAESSEDNAGQGLEGIQLNVAEFRNTMIDVRLATQGNKYRSLHFLHVSCPTSATIVTTSNFAHKPLNR